VAFWLGNGIKCTNSVHTGGYWASGVDMIFLFNISYLALAPYGVCICHSLMVERRKQSKMK
jgi:hypothetical protein